jgi:hypothetical protein
MSALGAKVIDRVSMQVDSPRDDLVKVISEEGQPMRRCGEEKSRVGDLGAEAGNRV